MNKKIIAPPVKLSAQQVLAKFQVNYPMEGYNNMNTRDGFPRPWYIL